MLKEVVRSKLQRVPYMRDPIIVEGKDGYSGAPIEFIPQEKTTPLNSDYVADLIRCGRIVWNRGWAEKTAGNISFRDGDVFGVTATKAPLGNLTIDDVLKVTGYDCSGEIPKVYYEGSLDKKPTSEILAHLKLYEARPNDNVCLHVHDDLVTENAPFLAGYSSSIARTSEHRVQGTEEFADSLVEIVNNSRNYLISQSHGAFSLGGDFSEAFFYASNVHRGTAFLERFGIIDLRYSELVEYNLSLGPLRGRVRNLTYFLEFLFRPFIRFGGAKVNMAISPFLSKFGI